MEANLNLMKKENIFESAIFPNIKTVLESISVKYNKK